MDLPRPFFIFLKAVLFNSGQTGFNATLIENDYCPPRGIGDVFKLFHFMLHYISNVRY